MAFGMKSIWIYLLIFFTSSALSAQDFSGLRFRSVGPSRGGRATSATGHPSQKGTFLMGTTGGGLWQTHDYGQNWVNLSDGFFASPSIGAQRYAPSKPQVIYVGTGTDGLRSNIISGKGVYKSVDSGKSWTHIGLEKTAHIGALEVHPTNPDVFFVAAIGNAFAPNPERGIFRTRNGGSSWDKVLFLSDTTGFSDLEFHPSNPDILYAGAWRAERKPWSIISGGREGGVYKSTDGGSSWQKTSKGLPKGLIGKIDLAVSPQDPKRVYALVEAPVGDGGLYRSDDEGENWRLVSSFKPLLDRPFYYCNVYANPHNADDVFVMATQFWRSRNAGLSWIFLSTPHGDDHDLWIHPQDSLLWIEANDGGANVSTNGGLSWSTQNNQPTAELYQVEVDDQFPYWLYAGQQDNYTTISVPSLPPFDPHNGYLDFLRATGGCETGPAVPKPGNPDIVYANCKGCFSVYNKKTGQEQNYFVGASNIYGHLPRDLRYRFQRVSPIHVSPHNPKIVYHASQYLHRTLDEGKTWEIISPDLTANETDKQVISGSPITRDVTGEEFYSTIYEVRESPKLAGVIWVGANDGPIHVTRNAGKTWQKVTPSMPGGGRVDCIDPSPHQPGKAVAAILRYQLGDWKPYIFLTENYGASWRLITKGLPADCPVRTVREDPVRAGLLYAGTEYGMYISFDNGENWRPFQQNLPLTPITDMKIHRGDLVLSTMGRGFWIMDKISALQQWTPELVQRKAHLFKPADAIRMRYAGNVVGNEPHYPAPQAVFDYFLGSAPQGELIFEILNAQGKVIRAWTSAVARQDTLRIDGNSGMASGFRIAGYSDQLRKRVGHNRFSWDLRHLGLWDQHGVRSSRGAPLAACGQYTARLKVDGQTLSQVFRLLPDPRLLSTGVSEKDLQAQEALALQVLELESQAFILSESVKKINAQGPDPSTKTILDQLIQELHTAEGRYMQPRLVDQISYLRNMLDQGDQKPGKDAYDRYTELKAWLQRLEARFQVEASKKTVDR
jgi:photosystem II stability/assembly factor-like uncharacterized protein